MDKKYIEYLIEFHTNRDYFECHEIGEEQWKDDTVGDKDAWLFFIKIAVAMYHWRRGNFEGAIRTMRKALNLINKEGDILERFGMLDSEVSEAIVEVFGKMENRLDYESFNFPLKDEELILTCKNMSREKGLSFGNPSDINNDYLINKHKFRDRTDVIEARRKELKKRMRQNK